MKEVEKALKTIRTYSGVRKTPEINKAEREAWKVIRENMEESVCDIDAATFPIDPRYVLQLVTIPEKKQGNLKEYAGKEVYLFTTTITRSGGRIRFYICEA